MAAGVRTIKTRFTGDNKSLNRASAGASKSVSGFSRSLGALKKVAKVGALAVAAVAASAVALGPKLLDQAAQLELMANKAKVVFEDQIGTVQKWARRNAAAMGLTSREAVGLAASFADLLKPMGFSAKQATAMSTDVVGLSGALSEWSGGQRSASEVADILSKAMLGERDGLKQLGISISEADVQARLAAKGQEDLTGRALEQAKALATQELIFEKSTDAQKAYEKGGQSLSRMLNTGKARLREFAQNMIVRLTPAIKAGAKFVQENIVPALRSMAAWVNERIVPALKEFGRWIQAEVLPRLQALWAYIQANIIPIIKQLAEKWIADAKKAWQEISAVIEEHRAELTQLAAGFKKVVDFIVQRVLPVVGPMLVSNFKFLIVIIKVIVATIAFWVRSWNTLWKATSSTVTNIRNAVTSARDWIKGRLNDVVGFFRNLPRRISSAASGMFDGLRGAFRNAINWIIDRWNGLSFRLPSITVFGRTVGGATLSTPDIPRLHDGGVFRAPFGEREGLALLRDRERVLTPEQQQEPGDVHVTVMIEGRALDESMTRVVSTRDRRLRRRAGQRSGAAR